MVVDYCTIEISFCLTYYIDDSYAPSLISCDTLYKNKHNSPQ